MSISHPTEVQTNIVQWGGRNFELRNVKASLIQMDGQEVLKIERDLEMLPFDLHNESKTVDEPTYARLKDFEFTDGIFEVKVLSRVQQPSPFSASQGFLGITFRIAADDSAFESIYLRPNTGRSNNQLNRNHAVQYFSYPDYKFNRLRTEYPGLYETYADIGLDEWITVRIHVNGDHAELYLNDGKYPAFIVNSMKGSVKSGTIGFFVDIGTEGYFKDFKIISFINPKMNGGA